MIDPRTDDRFAGAMLAIALVGLVVSGISPFDRVTWLLEVAPVMIVVPIVVATRRRFPLTPLLMALIAIHALVLELGGHYTYARVPLGEWIGEAFGFERNHYDRIGHFVQGFVPAVAVREILIRTTPLRTSKMLGFLVLCVCMAVSAAYEIIEWWTALAEGGAATDFLGTQGDPWDTQTDMAMAGIGAIVSQFVLARNHDAQLRARGFFSTDRGAPSIDG